MGVTDSIFPQDELRVSHKMLALLWRHAALVSLKTFFFRNDPEQYIISKN